ncbi:hypothetical protein C8J57DRAFT_1252331 [Mycena rebaudengoi]|nr:hypothetical protein C8J57DRAFT_1252331 [Mycena rebaudengoi]
MSSSFSLENIDPQLRDMDPARQLLQRMQSADERQAVLFMHVLQVLDLVKKNEKVSEWKVSKELGKKIGSYAQAFVLSPSTTSYRGVFYAEHILKAMREIGVAGIPSDAEVEARDIVLTAIRNKSISHRNVLKTKLKASTDKKSDMRNIAVLASKVAAGSKIQLTVQLYQRLAFLRFCLTSYPGLSDDDFWPKVDEVIDDYRRNRANKTELDQVFNEIYETDKTTYGDPADTEIRTVDSQDGINMTISKHAGNIEPVRKKRKLADVEAEEEAGQSTSPNDDDE